MARCVDLPPAIAVDIKQEFVLIQPFGPLIRSPIDLGPVQSQL